MLYHISSDWALTIARTLKLVSYWLLISSKYDTYAQTWVPCSGMMVNRTSSSFSRTHATGPSEAREAVSSGVGEHK